MPNSTLEMDPVRRTEAQSRAMATLFLLADGRIGRLDCPDQTPLTLDADGRPAAAGWAVAVVPFAAAARAPRRHALVAAPGTAVVLAGRLVDTGLAELRDGDHFLVGALEFIFSTDAVPEPVPGDGAPCPVCCEPLDDGRRLFRCARCGLTACSRCLSLAPRGVCMTTTCGASTALERPLWAPEPDDFVSLEAEA